MVPGGTSAAEQTQLKDMSLSFLSLWPADSQLWLAQVEPWFALRQITDKQTWLHCMIGALFFYLFNWVAQNDYT